MNRSEALLIVSACLTAAVPKQALADDTLLIPVSSWIIQQGSDKIGAAFICAATAEYVVSPDAAFNLRESFQILGNGKLNLHTSITAGITPKWTNVRLPSEQKPVVANVYAWFNDRRMITAALSAGSTLQGDDLVLGDASPMLQALSNTTLVTYETSPGTVNVRNGQRVLTPGPTRSIAIEAAASLTSSLQDCLAASKQKRTFLSATVPPLKTRSTESQNSLRQRIADAEAAASPSSGRPAGVALLALGQAQADAMRYGEAAKSLEAAVAAFGNSNTSLADTAKSRLVEVLIELERLDEAESSARKLSSPQRWLAAIAIKRGDHERGALGFAALVAEQLNVAIRTPGDLFTTVEYHKFDASSVQLRNARSLILLWASTSFGQEAWFSRDKAYFTRRTSGRRSAALLGSDVFDYIDPGMLQDSGADLAEDRAQLGRAAYFRGESSRRLGYLQSPASDLQYAQFELADLPDQAAWFARTRLAQAALEADRGNDAAALDQAKSTLSFVESSVGTSSAVWAENSLLISKLEMRLGDPSGAYETAVRAEHVAEQSLSSTHSLTGRLELQAAAALVAQKKIPEGEQAAAKIVGLPNMPDMRKAEYDALLTSMSGSKSPDQKLTAISNAIHMPKELENRATVEYMLRWDVGVFLRDTGENSDPSSRNWRFSAAANALSLEYLSLFGFNGPNKEYESRGKSRNPLDKDLSENIFDFNHSFEVKFEPFFQMATNNLRDSAYSWVKPENMLPGDYRPSISAGEELDQLEVALRSIQQHWETSGRQNEDLVNTLLQLAAAATRGDAYTTIATRAFARARNAQTSQQSLQRDNNSAAEAVSAEMFMKRVRGQLATTINSTSTPEERARRLGQVRRTYINALSLIINVEGALSDADVSSGAMLMRAMQDQYSSSGLSEMAIRKTLNEGDAAIIWVPLEHSTHVVLISPSQTVWAEISTGRQELGRRIASIRKEIETELGHLSPNAPPAPTLSEFPIDDAFVLYKTLFGSIEPALQGTKHLYVAQLGIVGALPIRTLITTPAKAGNVPTWLADRFAITRMPALIDPSTAHTKDEEPNSARLPYLAVGAPVLASVTEPDPAMAVLGDLPALADPLELPDLGDADGEMAHVANVLGIANPERSILSGKAATFDNIERRIVGKPISVLLFATHGLAAGDENIGEPALVLSTPEHPNVLDDGLFRASEISQLSLDVQLTILSACSTASSGEDGDEPLAGLAASFIAAGSKDVVASYWTVRDDVASDLTGNLVNTWAHNDHNTAEALQVATATLRQTRGGQSLSHPVFWAAFEVLGYPGSSKGYETHPAKHADGPQSLHQFAGTNVKQSLAPTTGVPVIAADNEPVFQLASSQTLAPLPSPEEIADLIREVIAQDALAHMHQVEPPSPQRGAAQPPALVLGPAIAKPLTAKPPETQADALAYLKSAGFPFDQPSYFASARAGRDDLVAAYLKAGMSASSIERLGIWIDGTALTHALFTNAENICSMINVFGRYIDLSSPNAFGTTAGQSNSAETLLDLAINLGNLDAVRCLRGKYRSLASYTQAVEYKIAILRILDDMPQTSVTLNGAIRDCDKNLKYLFGRPEALGTRADQEVNSSCLFRDATMMKLELLRYSANDIWQEDEKFRKSQKDGSKYQPPKTSMSSYIDLYRTIVKSLQ